MAGKTYNQKWKLSAEDRTKAALMTARQNVRGLDHAFGSATRAVGLFVPQLSAMAGAAGLAGAVKMVHDTAAELDDLAKRASALGMTSDELDAWNYAADLSGVSADQLGVGLRTLTKQMSDAARGTGEGRIAFEKLGVQVKDEHGRLKDVTSVMLELARGMEAIEDPTERAAMAQKAFGESGTGLVNLFKDGPEAVRSWLIEAHSLGTRFDDLTELGEDYEDAQLRLNRALRGTRDAVAVAALPALTALAETMANKVATAVTGLGKEYREFVGSLRVVPHQMALEMIADKEVEVREQLARTRARIDENQKRYDELYASQIAGTGVGAGAAEYRAIVDAQDEFGTSVVELEKQLRSLEEEKARVQQRMDLLAEAEKRWSEATTDARTAVGDLTKEQQDASRIIEGLLSSEEKYDAAVVDLNAHLLAGRLSQEQYNRAIVDAGEAWDRANPALQEHNRLLERGRQIAESVATPYERYLAAIREIEEVRAAGGLQDVSYDRAMAAAAKEYEESLRTVGEAGEDSMSTMQDAGVSAARSIGSAIKSMASGAKSDLASVGDVANEVLGQIAESLLQAGLIDPMIAGLTGKAGGGTAQAATYSGEYYGPPAPGDKAAAAAGAATVQINVSAMDTAGAVAVLQKHEAQIVGMVQKAFNRRAMPGPMGY